MQAQLPISEEANLTIEVLDISAEVQSAIPFPTEPEQRSVATHIPTEPETAIEISSDPEKAVEIPSNSEEVPEDKSSESEDSHKTCEKPAVACWILCFIFVLVPIWASLVLADMGIYIGCRIAYVLAHYLGASCIAMAQSTTKYKTDGDRHSKEAKDSAKCVDEICNIACWLIGIGLYVVAVVTFGIAKMAIAILPCILPIESWCEWIVEHDENFVWLEPNIEPTHTETKISTRYV